LKIKVLYTAEIRSDKGLDRKSYILTLKKKLRENTLRYPFCCTSSIRNKYLRASGSLRFSKASTKSRYVL